MVGDIFSLVLNFTLWNDVCMVHIIWIFINVFCSKFVFCRKLILHTFKVQWYIQTIVNLKTIVDHCPQNFENHRKTIDTNGWTLKKHSIVMVQCCQNHWKTIKLNGGLKKNINHSIALKNWPSSWSNRVCNFVILHRVCNLIQFVFSIQSLSFLHSVVS